MSTSSVFSDVDGVMNPLEVLYPVRFGGFVTLSRRKEKHPVKGALEGYRLCLDRRLAASWYTWSSERADTTMIFIWESTISVL